MVEQDKITREEALAYKHFDKSKKKGTGYQESLASNDVALEDWIKEVKSLVARKLKVVLTTLILPIKFMRREDYEWEFDPKRKEKILVQD